MQNLLHDFGTDATAVLKTLYIYTFIQNLALHYPTDNIRTVHVTVLCCFAVHALVERRLLLCTLTLQTCLLSSLAY